MAVPDPRAAVDVAAHAVSAARVGPSECRDQSQCNGRESLLHLHLPKLPETAGIDRNLLFFTCGFVRHWRADFFASRYDIHSMWRRVHSKTFGDGLI